jgi:hypothetical protein
MEAGPPALMQAVVRLLIPPACREHVLGDLCERYRSRRRYAFEALTTIPFVVASRIRRTSSVGLLAIQAICVSVGFWGETSSGLAETAIAAVGAIIILLARDAYRGRDLEWPRTAAVDALAAVSGAVFGYVVLAGPSGLNATIALSDSFAAFDSFVLIFAVRLLSTRAAVVVPPIRDRIRFVLVSLAYSAVFAVAASMVVGLLSGFLFAAMAAKSGHPDVDHVLASSVGRIWAVTPVVADVIALALCIVCRLPGTSVTVPRSLT